MLLVNNMKKIIFTFLSAILIGAVLGVYSYHKFYEDDVAPVSKALNNVYAIQVGVFESFDNANKIANRYEGIVINENNKYRVYIAIASKSIFEIKNYFDEKGISYYVRNIDVDNEFYNTLISFEKLLLESNKENYDVIIKKILKEYEMTIV